MKTSTLRTSVSAPKPAQALPPHSLVEPPPSHSRERKVSAAAAGRVDARHRDPGRTKDARPAVAASEAQQRIRARHFIGKAVAHHRSRHPAP